MSNADQLYKPYSTKSIDSQSSYTGRYLKIFDEQAKNRIGSYNFLNDQKGQQLKSYTDRNDNSRNVIFEDDNESLVYHKSQKQNISKEIFGDLERMKNQHIKMMEKMEEKTIEIPNKLSQIQNQFKRKSVESYVPQFGSLTNYEGTNFEKQQNKIIEPTNFNQQTQSKPNIVQNSQTTILTKQISFEPRFTFAPPNPIDFSNHINQNQNSHQQIPYYVPSLNQNQKNSIPVKIQQKQQKFQNKSILKQKQPIHMTEQTKAEEVNYANFSNLSFPKISQFKQQQIEFKQIKKIQQPNLNNIQQQKQLVNKNVIIKETKNIQIQPITKQDTTQIYLQQQSNVQQNKNKQAEQRKIQPINQQVITTQQQVVNYAQQYQEYIASSFQPNPRILNAIKFVKQVEDKMKKYSNTMQQLNKMQPKSYFNKQNLYNVKTHQSNQYQKPYMQFKQPFVNNIALENIEQVESIVNPPSLPIYQNINYSPHNVVIKQTQQSHKIRNDSPYKRITPQPTLRNININYHVSPQLIKQPNNTEFIQPSLRKRTANIPIFNNNTPLTIKKQIIRPNSHDPRFSAPKRILTQPTFYGSKALPLQIHRNSKAENILQPNYIINPIRNQHIIVNRPASSHIIPSKTITYQPPRVNFSPLKVINNQPAVVLSNSSNNITKATIQRSNMHKRPASTGISLVSTRR